MTGIRKNADELRKAGNMKDLKNLLHDDQQARAGVCKTAEEPAGRDGTALPDEQLDAVSGGTNRKQYLKKPQPCLGECGRTTTDESGLCQECFEKWYKNGWRPVL